MLKEISYDLIGRKHDQSIKEMQLAEDAKVFAILFGFPPSNTISPRTYDDTPITHRHNVWLRKYYLRKFKERMNQLCH